MNSISAQFVNLKYTFDSAQPLTFHAEYRPRQRRLTYVKGKAVIDLRFSSTSRKTRIEFLNGRSASSKEEVVSRFRLGDDIGRMYDRINTDSNISSAIRRYRGMRVTLNGPWETTLCFIISQLNNVKRIRKIIRSIMERYGEVVHYGDDAAYFSFPDADAMSSATVDELMRCGAGFRAKYVVSAARYCNDNLDLGRLARLKYPELKEELMSINGIGEKVADCIALMGYGKLEAFPIDVWVKRTMERLYFKGHKTDIREIRRFATDRWGECAGFAQQYIFWYGRDSLGR